LYSFKVRGDRIPMPIMSFFILLRRVSSSVI
jgi:hypothetical protein